MTARLVAGIAIMAFAGCDSGHPSDSNRSVAGANGSAARATAAYSDARENAGEDASTGTASPSPPDDPEADEVVCTKPLVDPYEDVMPRLRVVEPDEVVGRRDLSDASLFDLDGDGRKDFALEVRDWCGTGGCNYWLYLWRDGCGKYVGQIDGKDIESAGPGAHGLVDITSTWWLGCCSKVERTARYDGKLYRVSERDCHSESDASGERTWKCGRWHAERR